MNIDLHEKQTAAFLSPATEMLYGGAAGGGKSHLMRSAAALWCCEIPGLQVYLFRRKFPDLWKNHMEGPSGFPNMFAEEIQAGLVKINYSKNTIEFWNGSKIFMCHCQHEKDMYNYQGAEMHVLLIDELTHFTDKIYRYLRGRVRMVGITLPDKFKNCFPRIINGSNPGGIGHNWVKLAFVDSAPEFRLHKTVKKEGGMIRQYIPARMDDNPSLCEADPDYLDRLEGLGDPALVEAMKAGDWDIVSGGMFDDLWDRDLHVLVPFAIPSSWYIDRSFDWGSSAPFSVGWWAESDGTEATLHDGTKRCWPRGTLFRIAEWYGWKKGDPNKGLLMEASEIAIGILHIEEQLGLTNRVEAGPADSSIFDEVDAHCIAQNMLDEGVDWTHANKKPGSRVNGWALMRGRLKAAKKWPMENPGLFVFNTCNDGFIRTIPVLPRDERNRDDVNTQSEDHCGDEVRYRTLSKQLEGITEQSLVGF